MLWLYIGYLNDVESRGCMVVSSLDQRLCHGVESDGMAEQESRNDVFVRKIGAWVAERQGHKRTFKSRSGGEPDYRSML